MRTQNLFFLILMTFFIACHSNQSELKPTPDGPGIVHSDNEIYEYLFNMSKYDWEDLHQYYLRLKENGRSEPDFDNVRGMAIFHMIENFDLLKSADDEVLRYYMDEMLSLPYLLSYKQFVDLLEVAKLRDIIDENQASGYARRCISTFENTMAKLSFEKQNKLRKEQNEGVLLLKSLVLSAD